MKATQPWKPTAKEPRKAGRAGQVAHCPGGSEKTWLGSEETIPGKGETAACSAKKARGFSQTGTGRDDSGACFAKGAPGLWETAPGSGKTGTCFAESAAGFSATAPGHGKTGTCFAQRAPGFTETAPGGEKTGSCFFRKAPCFSMPGGVWALTVGRLGRLSRGVLSGGPGRGDAPCQGAFACRPSEAQAHGFWDGLRWPLFGCLFFGRTPPLRQGIPH